MYFQGGHPDYIRFTNQKTLRDKNTPYVDDPDADDPEGQRYIEILSWDTSVNH